MAGQAGGIVFVDLPQPRLVVDARVFVAQDGLAEATAGQERVDGLCHLTEAIEVAAQLVGLNQDMEASVVAAQPVNILADIYSNDQGIGRSEIHE
jgi:hypothetical protein